MTAILEKLQALVDADDDHMVAKTDEELEWLIEQSLKWPSRIHPERTTNSRFLRYSVAATFLEFLKDKNKDK